MVLGRRFHVIDPNRFRVPSTRPTHWHRKSRCLSKSTPVPRPIQPGNAGEIIAFPQVGGLHHRYKRKAA
jgi:hypothetical protein